MDKKDPFSPITIGGIEAGNRIMRSAVNDHLGNPDGTVSDAQIDMYDVLARNEIGSIITGHISVLPELDCRADPVQLSAGDDGKIDGLRRIADKVHEYGGVAVAQISHAGSRGMKRVDFNELPSDSLKSIGGLFVDAAARVQAAGFDAVEVHAAHWYMLASMLNADINCRTDEYGGDASGRLRLTRHIVEGIRSRCGSEFGIFVKLNAHNTLAGIDDEYMLVDYARELQAAGVDLVDVSGMSFAKQARSAECYFIDAARRVKEACPEPVVALVGGIFSRATIERALDAVDMASLGRTLLTQPDFIARMRAGEAEQSRCIRCNKCFEVFKTKFERCIFGPVNPKLKETFGGEDSK